MDVLRRIIFFPVAVVFFVTRWLLWAILQALPDSTDLDSKIEAIRGNRDPRTLLDQIYTLLNILDSKASALMRYNGIILAVLALLLGRGAIQALPAGHAASAYIWIVYLTLASILACLLVVGVYWRFFEFVRPPNDFAEELSTLRRVLLLREAAYQIAWWLAVIVSIANFSEYVSALKSIQEAKP
jgi:hypothetical protein